MKVEDRSYKALLHTAALRVGPEEFYARIRASLSRFGGQTLTPSLHEEVRQVIMETLAKMADGEPPPRKKGPPPTKRDGPRCSDIL